MSSPSSVEVPAHRDWLAVSPSLASNVVGNEADLPDNCHYRGWHYLRRDSLGFKRAPAMGCDYLQSGPGEFLLMYQVQLIPADVLRPSWFGGIELEPQGAAMLKLNRSERPLGPATSTP